MVLVEVGFSDGSTNYVNKLAGEEGGQPPLMNGYLELRPFKVEGVRSKSMPKASTLANTIKI